MKSFMFCMHKYSEEMGRACHTWRRKEMHIGFFVGTHEGKRLLGRPRHRWEDNM